MSIYQFILVIAAFLCGQLAYKNRAAWLLAGICSLLCLATGCHTDADEYQKAQSVAEKAPLTSEVFGFGFRPDMLRPEVEARISKMAGTTEMYLPLPSGDGVDAKWIKPGYTHDTLATVNIFFMGATEAQFGELCQVLRKRYGGPELTLDNGEGEKLHSWFRGPVKITTYHYLAGIMLDYDDLRRYNRYLSTSAEQDMHDDSVKTAAAAEKL